MMPLSKRPEIGSGGGMGMEGEHTQAGRSSSHLGAERDAAILRAESSTSDLRTSERPPLGRTASDELQRRIAILAASRSSFPPSIPSPLNPARSLSPLVTPSEVEVHKGKGKEAGKPGTQELPPATGRRKSSGESRGRNRDVRNGPHDAVRQKSESATASKAPRFLVDLGKDYSRYPMSSANSEVASRAQSQAPANARTSSATLLSKTTRTSSSDSKVAVGEFDYPDDRIGVLNPYFGGEKGFILLEDEKEADDEFHMPEKDEKSNDKPKTSGSSSIRSVASLLGGIVLILGLIVILLIFPILAYSRSKYASETSGKEEPPVEPPTERPRDWAWVNDVDYPLLKNVRVGLIDKDTPQTAYTRKSTFDDSVLKLVFSDEFNTPNRTFYSGDDSYWTAQDIWYGATQDMEWYDPDAVTTGNGTLQLRMDRFVNHNLEFRSGMLTSWNQACFKGGVYEVSASLAGPAGVPGLWPGVWSIGNLGRPGYKATTEGVWPYTYNSCDWGITPNQSSPDGLSRLPGQKLSSCTCPGADHPNPGTGRGAPEIDILEGSVDPNNRIGVVTQSYQVAPFDIWYRPNNAFMQIPNLETTNMNSYCGGPFQQAISGVTMLNNSWYDDKNYQKFAFEYIPGTSEGKIAWFVGEDQTLMMDGRAIGPNGNVDSRVVSEEPMAMVLNLGISGSWSGIEMGLLEFPTVMHIDYVRVYQKEGQEMMTCDPPGYPTTEYIKNHPKAYMNPNLTEWDQTGYGWPKNTLMGC